MFSPLNIPTMDIRPLQVGADKPGVRQAHHPSSHMSLAQLSDGSGLGEKSRSCGVYVHQVQKTSANKVVGNAKEGIAPFSGGLGSR